MNCINSISFYNALNSNDQDSLNSAAGGNFLDKMPRECLKIIESKSKNETKTPASARLKAVEQSCVTCGGGHAYQNCPATNSNMYHEISMENCVQALRQFQSSNSGLSTSMRKQFQKGRFIEPPVPSNSRYSRTCSSDNASTSGSGNSPGNSVSIQKEDLKGFIPMWCYHQTSSNGGKVPSSADCRRDYPCVGKDASTFILDQTQYYTADYDILTANKSTSSNLACVGYSQAVLGFSNMIANFSFLALEQAVLETQLLSVSLLICLGKRDCVERIPAVTVFILPYPYSGPFLSTTIGDENPIRTLRDYSKLSHEGYRNTIELPEGNNMVPLRSDTIRLVQNECSFHGLWSEDPNQHLKDFLKLVYSLDFDGENRERTRLHLFQFSLSDQASNWLERLPT
ncbi:hypothetical protein Tco_0838320 [Tanacetum coccineum]|uniref:MAK10-like protein n=1 Tax=Tanacetum coccineum TaxID=301880 RepID=A0ABQ5ARQ6_9ASTR